LLLVATGAHAQNDLGLPPECLTEHASHDMGGASMDMSMLPPGDAHKALAAGMDRMHSDMMIGMTASDLDVAFVCGMIPHHQGAIDMARAELEYGDDPWVREMAQKVIDAQEAEIAQMKDWLRANAPAHAGH
jgi:uncharacterized protein (DUF305 family)